MRHSEIKLVLALIFIVIPGLLIIWFIRLIKIWSKGKPRPKSFVVETVSFILLVGTICYHLGLYPLAGNLYVKDISELITGKSFWSSKVYSFDEISARGEGFSLLVYQFNEDMAEYFMNPDSAFFDSYPLQLENRSKWEREKWKPTPVISEELVYLDAATPLYAGWRQSKKDQVNFVKNLAKEGGGFYAYNTRNGDVDFFIVSPRQKLIVIINHNK